MGIKDLISTLDCVVRYGQGDYRPGWRVIAENARKKNLTAKLMPKEVVLSVIEILKQSFSFLSTPSLSVDKWIPLVLINKRNMSGARRLELHLASDFGRNCLL